jgi:uncharacterized cofD-like protein
VKTQTETALEPLLLDPAGPAVVAIGGGHGQASALEAIQTYAGSISALVTVADNGGSSGRLSDFGIPPPGDIRRCLLALTPEPSLWSELFAHRFESGDVTDHSLGNLILAALTDLFGDFTTAVDTAGRMLGALGEVIPVADEPVTLSAVVEGVPVTGQAAITATEGHISEIAIDPPDVMASRRALTAVAAADQIVLGPGSLYTSVISALMVQMLAPAVMESNAQKVFVLNLVTQDGETTGMSGLEHVMALADHVGVRGPGTIVAHDGPIVVPPGHQAIVVEPEEAAAYGWDVVRDDLVDEWSEWPQHDPLKLARILEGLATTRSGDR